jgi:group I intron endonuclease
MSENIYTIYQSLNKVNSKSYIGYSSDYEERIRLHKRDYLNHNYYFYRAIRKYGWDSFEWFVLYQSKDKDHTFLFMEQYFIDLYESYRNGYNCTKGGLGVLGSIPFTKGKTYEEAYGKEKSDILRRQLSNSRLKENNPMYGQKHSQEFKDDKRKRWIGNKLKNQKWQILNLQTNEEFITDNLHLFCTENNINYDCLRYKAKMNLPWNQWLRSKEPIS